MKILICSDGSERSKRAISFATVIAIATKAETTIFGIAQNPQEELKLGESLLEESGELKANGVRVEITTKSGDPVTEIVQCTRDRAYDLVAIGAERRGAQDFFLPSETVFSIAKELSPPLPIVRGGRPQLKRPLFGGGGGAYLKSP